MPSDHFTLDSLTSFQVLTQCSWDPWSHSLLRVGWESAITQYLEPQIHLLPRKISDTQYTQGSVAFILMKWECDLKISDHLVHRIQGPSLPWGISEHSVLSVQITPYLHDPDTTEASNLETAVSRIWLQLETAYRLWLPGLSEKIPMQSQVPQTPENRQRWSSEMSALELKWAHFRRCVGKWY